MMDLILIIFTYFLFVFYYTKNYNYIFSEQASWLNIVFLNQMDFEQIFNQFYNSPYLKINKIINKYIILTTFSSLGSNFQIHYNLIYYMGGWCGKIQKRGSYELQEDRKYRDTQYTFNYEEMIQFKKTNFYNDYKVLELKGKGASGEVYRVYLKQGSCQRAAKIIKRKNQNQQLSNQLHNQYSILKKLDHPNIIKVYEIYQESKNFYIISEICSGGQLFEKIIEQKGFNERMAANYFYQILQAINYLHDHHIMHRDIKPQNLLFSDSSQEAYLKLIDFGSAIRFQSSEILQRRRVGTSYYIAPEVLKRKYNQKCDVWSCGIILYILLSGQPPFTGKIDEQILKKVQTGKFSFAKSIWKKISDQAKDLITKMIQKDIDKRYSVKEAIKHPWFNIRKNNNSTMVELKQCLINMQDFRGLKKIQEAILIFITNFLTKNEERDSLIKMFKKFDENGDGVISRQQLKNGYVKYYGVDQAQIQKQIDNILLAVDKNKSGSIDYTEFVIASMKKQISICDNKIQKAFKMLDIDGNGKLTIEQLKNMLGNNIPNQYYQQLVKEFDTNGDGQISKDEFFEMMKKISIKKLKQQKN